MGYLHGLVVEDRTICWRIPIHVWHEHYEVMIQGSFRNETPGLPASWATEEERGAIISFIAQVSLWTEMGGKLDRPPKGTQLNEAKEKADAKCKANEKYLRGISSCSYITFLPNPAV